MRLINHPEVRAELLEAGRFYRRNSSALAKQFSDEIAGALAVTQERPERWRSLRANVRTCRLPRSPYTILYRATVEGLKVFAYKHDRRQPDYWLGRLND